MGALLPASELLPGFVTSDLQAARADFIKPEAARLVHVNAAGEPMIVGGALILAGVHYHVIAGAAGVGFTLNHVFDGVTTALFSVQSQGAGVLSRSTSVWRPLATPYNDVGSGAVNGGYIALALIGAPAAGSFLEVEVWHHSDTLYTSRHTVLSPVNGDLQF